MEEEERKLRHYLTLVEEIRHEGDLLWTQYGSFLLVQTVFLAFLLQSALSEGIIFQFNFGVMISSLIGLLLCVPWLGTFLRTKKFYKFRLAQAAQAEPKDWRFIADKGKDYAQGKPVLIGEETFQMKWFERKFKPTNSAIIVIYFFITIYVLLSLMSSPISMIF